MRVGVLLLHKLMQCRRCCIGLVWFLHFSVLPCFPPPSLTCYIYCLLVSFKKGGERDRLEEYFWSFCVLLLSFNNFVASTVYTFLPIMYKTQRIQMETNDVLSRQAPTNFPSWLKGCVNVATSCSFYFIAAAQTSPADSDSGLARPTSTTLWDGASKWVLHP